MAPSVVEPRPAAALVLARPTGDGLAVYMVRRHGQSRFMPDVWVFPGGTVQDADRRDEMAPGLCAPAGEGITALGSGFRLAAIRECFEEAGVLLAYRDGAQLALAPDEVPRYAAHRGALNAGSTGLAAVAASEGLVLATDALLHWAHWVTPEGLPRRFDTHFFLAAMPEGQAASHDRLETSEGIWIRPEEALAESDERRFPLTFPTIHQLRALGGLTDLDAARERFAGKPVRRIMPTLHESGGEQVPHLPEEP